MLAQEQTVIMRSSGLGKEIEGGLGRELEGTLLLTNRQVIFVTTHEKEEDFTVRTGFLGGYQRYRFRFVYADVDDIKAIPRVPGNLFIPVVAISSVTGHGAKGGLERPSLEVKWNDAAGEQGRVFIEKVEGRSRRKNLNDWAPVIERLKSGDQKLLSLPKPPSTETLEGKIMRILADVQRKGLYTIEDQVETAFNIKLDPDEVQKACDSLATQGLVKREPDSKSGDVYYQKLTPLGENDLSDY